MKKLFAIIALLMSLNSFAQNCSVSGLLFDKTSRQALPFASVQVKGTNIGVMCDADGMFLIEDLQAGYIVLIASFVGYKDTYSSEIRLKVSRQAYLEIALLPDALELGEVSVVASPFRKKIESPLSMQRIGIADIENSPGGNSDISVVIQSFPGVRANSNFRNDIVVRGGGPSENVFVIDGVEIPVINHFATQGASGGPVGIINVAFIDEVNLYTGAFPAKYGNVMSSVMDIKMSLADKKKINYVASLGASEASFSFNGPLTEKSSLIFSLRQSYLQFLFKALDLPFLPTFTDAQFKYNYDINENYHFSAFAISSLDKMRLNTGNSNLSEERRAILDYLPESDQYSYSFGSVLRHTKNNRIRSLKFGSSLLGNSSDKYLNNDRSLASNKLLDYSSKEYRNTLTLDEIIFMGENKLNFGIEYKHNKISGENYLKEFVDGTLNEFVYNKSFSLNIYALYAQYSAKLFNESLVYSAGLRMESSDVNKSTKNALKHISPRLSLSYKIDESWSINANTGVYYSLPGLLSLSYKVDGIFKNNDLPYIQSIHWVAGLEYNLNANTHFTLEYFNKRYDDYPFSVADGLSLANKGGGFALVGDELLTADSKGKAEGFEFMTRYQSVWGLNLLFAYTFVKSEFTDKNGDYIPSSWDNKHILTLTASQKFSNDWGVGMKWRYLGGDPYTPYDMDKSSLVSAWDVKNTAYLDYSRFNELRRSDFHQLDLRVDKAFNFDHWSFKLYVDIQNVYNFTSKGSAIIVRETNENGVPIIVNPSEPSESARYQLKELKNENGSILPSFGFVIEF